jgi:hypothetical protein
LILAASCSPGRLQSRRRATGRPAVPAKSDGRSLPPRTLVILLRRQRRPSQASPLESEDARRYWSLSVRLDLPSDTLGSRRQGRPPQRKEVMAACRSALLLSPCREGEVQQEVITEGYLAAGGLIEHRRCNRGWPRYWAASCSPGSSWLHSPGDRGGRYERRNDGRSLPLRTVDTATVAAAASSSIAPGIGG